MKAADESDFEAFVVARSAQLLRLALGLTGDRGTAEDLLQTALTKTYVNWSKVRRADDPDAYVRRLLVNTHTSWWRRRRVAEVLTDVPRTQSVHQQAAVEDLDALAQALAHLGPRQRAVVVLRYYEDRPDAEIAALLGCSEATVRSQASRGLAVLRSLPALDHHRPPHRLEESP